MDALDMALSRWLDLYIVFEMQGHNAMSQNTATAVWQEYLGE